MTIGLCFFSKKGYSNVNTPFHPKERYVELGFLPAGSDFINLNNEIYEGVRQLLALLKLDIENFGRPTWNPLGELLKPGNTVVIKPNLVRHFNENLNGTLDSVITHGSILRPIVDYCLKALDFKGRIIIADAPQHDCDIEQVKSSLGIEVLRNFYSEHFNPFTSFEGKFELEFLDLRQEFVRFTNGIITERTKLLGDPLGYSVVDLGEDSAFNDMKVPCDLLRGADYDEEETIVHHSNGKHEYLISNTVLNADLVINVPKIKTHKKAGVTLALKNMVGINGNKNWLPHHRAGFPDEGDEFPTRKMRNVIRGFAAEKARYFLKQGKFQRLFRFARQMENVFGGAPAIRSGNWYGNDTIWRTVIDLNKILFFSDKDGKLHNEPFSDRKYLVIFDGVVAGEGNGPMAPMDKTLGVICGGFDPILTDILLVKLMGFDWRKIPKIYYSAQLDKYRYTVFTESDDMEVEIFHQSNGESERLRLSEVGINWGFKPHFGWEGYIERLV